MRHAWLGLLMLFALDSYAAAPACGTEGVAVQVLGSGDASLTAQRAGSGVLVWVHGKARVLVNAGSGVALRFQESGAHWNDLDAIVFTRVDVAHSADLPALLQAAHAGGRNRALRVYGPTGNKFAPSTVTFVRDLFDPVRGSYRHLGTLLAPLDRSGYKLDPHDVREPPAKLAAPRRKGPTLLPVFGNEQFQLKAVLHAAEPAPVLSWRVDAGAASVVVDGGARDAPEPLVALAEGALMLVMPDPSPDGIGRLKSAAHPRQTLLVARGARTAAREDEILAGARKSARGEVIWADDLACYRF